MSGCRVLNFNPRHPYGWRPDTPLRHKSSPDISIHATHTGGDYFAPTSPPITSNFNPRHPYGWRPSQLSYDQWVKQFQSTPPIRVATAFFWLSGDSSPFQSTPPIRVATRDAVPCRLTVEFQSTPPIRVATMLRYSRFCFDFYFNPRHPYGWRPYCVLAPPRPRRFQSTPPIRVATLCYDMIKKRGEFQSTPPIRVATYLARKGEELAKISIHATHTGGDCSQTPGPAGSSDFNPRHPYGWRQLLKALYDPSILFQSTPPIRVATAMPRYNRRLIEFQSTPPIRVATAACSDAEAAKAISIHATHTGGDISRAPNSSLSLIFQSTPPIRVATRSWSWRMRYACHFNPRHPYGWRRTRFVVADFSAIISIHATHTGGDPIHFRTISAIWNFNPRHPYGWRRG